MGVNWAAEGCGSGVQALAAAHVGQVTGVGQMGHSVLGTGVCSGARVQAESNNMHSNKESFRSIFPSRFHSNFL